MSCIRHLVISTLICAFSLNAFGAQEQKIALLATFNQSFHERLKELVANIESEVEEFASRPGKEQYEYQQLLGALKNKTCSAKVVSRNKALFKCGNRDLTMEFRPLEKMVVVNDKAFTLEEVMDKKAFRSKLEKVIGVGAKTSSLEKTLNLLLLDNAHALVGGVVLVVLAVFAASALFGLFLSEMKCERLFKEMRQGTYEARTQCSSDKVAVMASSTRKQDTKTFELLNNFNTKLRFEIDDCEEAIDYFVPACKSRTVKKNHLAGLCDSFEKLDKCFVDFQNLNSAAISNEESIKDSPSAGPSRSRPLTPAATKH